MTNQSRIDRTKKVIVYGDGIRTKAIINLIVEDLGMEVGFCIDKDVNKQGNEKYSVPVIGLEDALNIGIKDKYIFISSFHKYNEILEILLDIGIDKENILNYFNEETNEFFNTELQEIIQRGYDVQILGKGSVTLTKFTGRILLQAHVFYTDLLNEVIEAFNKVPYGFDCYISTDTEEKKLFIEKEMKEKCIANKIYVEVFKNVGRDVAPFILQVQKVYTKYDYICHIHTKKTHIDGKNIGDGWRKYLYDTLFNRADKIIDMFEQEDRLGVVFPMTWGRAIPQDMDMDSEDFIQLLNLLEIDIKQIEVTVFPVGTMFWAKSKAIERLFIKLTEEDFIEDDGQLYGTIYHAIERVIVAVAEGYGHQMVLEE